MLYLPEISPFILFINSWWIYSPHSKYLNTDKAFHYNCLVPLDAHTHKYKGVQIVPCGGPIIRERSDPRSIHQGVQPPSDTGRLPFRVPVIGLYFWVVPAQMRTGRTRADQSGSVFLRTCADQRRPEENVFFND